MKTSHKEGVGKTGYEPKEKQREGSASTGRGQGNATRTSGAQRRGSRERGDGWSRGKRMCRRSGRRDERKDGRGPR